MFYLGWLMFFGIHAGMLFPALKRPLASWLGESGYKGVYSLISVVGLVLLIYGYERGGFFDVQSPPWVCLLYTSPSPRDRTRSRMPSSA